MKRTVYSDLVAWKNRAKGKTVLLIEGARRVGKSYIATEFGKNEYKTFMVIDFSNTSKEIKELFENYLNDLDSFYSYLTAITNTKLINRESLIIFDEVQMFPKAREALKTLVQDGRFDFIETGSLVSIKKNVKDIVIPSEEETLKMYPMSFEEFLMALDREDLWTLILDSWNNRKPLPDSVHRKIMQYLRKYLVIGGMPQAVEKYIETKDLLEVEIIKRNILNLYKNDIAKHTANYEWKVRSVFDLIPTNLKEKEGVFRFADINSNARYRDFKEALYWLEDAFMVNFCYKVSDPNLGMKQSIIPEKFKCYLSDTGLLITLVFDENDDLKKELYEKLLLGSLEINEGMFIENLVAQMLVASKNRLYYYAKNSITSSLDRMEIDFLIQKETITNKHNIIPIEVKSGKNYTFSSLKKFKNKFSNYVFREVLIHTGNLKVDEQIMFVPLYMTPLIRQLTSITKGL